MSIDPGRRIGAYEIVGPLGSGGMGEVYRARDTRLGRAVAIKFVSSDLAADAVSTERLAREARLTSSLNHPNIVTVYDVGETDGRPFIVMELISGRSLHDKLDGGRLKAKEAADIGAQVAEGLAAAHEAGVVHRDLKPRNVMLTEDGRAKIVDFGLGKGALPAAGADDTTTDGQVLTDTHAIVGTAGYMAPEQVSGRPVDHRTDQFAHGAMMYEMLTGRRAFRRDTPVQTMAAILDAEPPGLASAAPETPSPLVTVVERCLAKDPAGRYDSTRDLARDLQDMRLALSPGSRSSHSVPRPPARGRGGWLAAAAVLVVAAVLSVAAPGWLQSLLPEDDVDPVSEARALLARYDRRDNVDRAVELLAAAVAAGATDASVQASLAEAYWRQYEHSRDPALIDRASEACAEAIRLDETEAKAHVVLAVINHGQGRYNGALGEADRAIALDAGLSAAHRERGRALLGLGRRDEARDALLRAVELGPEDWTAHNWLGAYYFSAGKIEDAARAFERALALAPDNTRAYNNLGGAFQRLERFDEAAAMFERSATLGQNASAFSNLGTLYYERGRYAEAAQAFERAVVLPGAAFRHWRNLGSAAYWAPGLRARAVEAYATAAELGEKDHAVDPRNQNVLAELADTYAVLGRPERARQLIGLLESQRPQDAQVLFTLAGTYEHLGERTLALDRLARAVEAGQPLENVERSPWLEELRKDAGYTRRFGGHRNF